VLILSKLIIIEPTRELGQLTIPIVLYFKGIISLPNKLAFNTRKIVLSYIGIPIFNYSI
jgi:hypothetical protein